MAVIPSRTARVARRWIAVTGAVWALLALYVAQIHLPHNAITLPGESRAVGTLDRMAPQGWGFFTKSPRDTELQPYLRRGGRWTNAHLGPHGAPRNAFGLDRRSRSQGIEMALLVNEADNAKWTDCADDTLTACLGDAGRPGTVTNTTPEPSLCGRTAIVRQEPVRFAWRDLLDGTHTPHSLTVLDVRC